MSLEKLLSINKNVMKKIVFTLFCLLLYLSTFAQDNNYHPLVQEGKVWSVLYVDNCGGIENYKFTTTKMAVWGDTIINDVPYKKMYASTKEYPDFPQDWTLQNFMREDEDKKIWYKKNATSNDQLYYIFSLEIGDTIPENIGFQQEPVIVEDITYMIMHNGEKRKAWHLSANCYGLFNHKEIWIEGIGSSLGVLAPITGELDGGFTRLLCVHENEKLIFDENFYWPGICYKSSSTGIDEYNNKKINVYPNPVTEILNIDNVDDMEITCISLMNIAGQIVRQYVTNINKINVLDIPAGFYFIKFSTNCGEIVQKVIIEK